MERNFKALLDGSCHTITSFASKYKIPARTVQNWYYGKSAPASYYFDYLYKAVNSEMLCWFDDEYELKNVIAADYVKHEHYKSESKRAALTTVALCICNKVNGIYRIDYKYRLAYDDSDYLIVAADASEVLQIDNDIIEDISSTADDLVCILNDKYYLTRPQGGKHMAIFF